MLRVSILIMLCCVSFCFPKTKLACVPVKPAADSVLVYKPGLILLNGYYNGKNIFVQNPFDTNNNKFCIQQYPTINGHVTNRIITSTAFEIDLTPFKFKRGAKVNIVIKHSIGCSPKVLNAEVLRKGYVGK